MSNVYNTIRQSKKIAEKLLENGQWNQDGVIKDMGVSFALYKDIMELHPVAVGDKIQKKSVDKMKAFIERYGSVLEKGATPVGVVHSKQEDPFPITRKPKAPGKDPLAELDALAKKFASRGYKLETRITKINA